MNISEYLRAILVALLICCMGCAWASEQPRVGLALSGGGAMGFAHIGILKMLDSLNIPVDYIAGTSMGGIAAALYAVGYSGREIEAIARSVDWQKTFNDRPPRQKLPYFEKKEAEKYQFEFGLKDFRPVDKGGAIVGQNIMLLFSRLVFDYLDVDDFDQLPIPFRCTAVDLISGSAVILKRGNLARAMRATMAVPSVFAPVEWGDSLLVDGGLLNNLPVDIVRDMGADIVIASAVGKAEKKRSEISGTFDVIAQSFYVLRDRSLMRNARNADLLIECQLKELGPADFVNRKILRIVIEGEKAAQKSVPRLLDLKETYRLERKSYCEQCREKPQGYRIGQINVIGNHTVPDVAIRSLFRVREQDLFNPDTIEYYLDQLLLTGDYRGVDYSTEVLNDSLLTLNIHVKEKEHPVIYGVYIRGNEKLSFDFIYRLLGVQPGDIFIHAEIEDRITYLYSLGYFDYIYYEIEPVAVNNVRFILHVKESPEYKLRVGIRYDRYHRLVAAVNFQMSNKPLPGIRIDNKMQIIGLNRFRSRAYYPSRTLDFPLYPFVEAEYREIPTYIYNLTGNKIAYYKDRSVRAGGGFGLLYKNYWNMELEGNFEQVNIHPDIAPDDPVQFPSRKEDFWQVRLGTNIDLLDDTFVPHQGFSLHADYEQSLRRVGKPHTNYYRFKSNAELYFSIGENHTCRLYGFYGLAEMDSANTKFLYQGGADSYVGVQYDQFLATRLGIARVDYRIQIRQNLYAKLIMNAAFHYENRNLAPGIRPEAMYGWGAGVKYMTPLGPFELIYGVGDRSVYQPGPKRSIVYFSAGYLL